MFEHAARFEPAVYTETMMPVGSQCITPQKENGLSDVFCFDMF